MDVLQRLTRRRTGRRRPEAERDVRKIFRNVIRVMRVPADEGNVGIFPGKLRPFFRIVSGKGLLMRGT